MQFFSTEIWQSWQHKRNHALDGQFMNRAVSKCVSNEVVESTNFLITEKKDWPTHKSDSKSGMVGLFSSYFFRPFIASTHYPRDFSGIFAIVSSLIHLLTHGSTCSYQTALYYSWNSLLRIPFLLDYTCFWLWKPYFFFFIWDVGQDNNHYNSITF